MNATICDICKRECNPGLTLPGELREVKLNGHNFIVKMDWDRSFGNSGQVPADICTKCVWNAIATAAVVVAHSQS